MLTVKDVVTYIMLPLTIFGLISAFIVDLLLGHPKLEDIFVTRDDGVHSQMVNSELHFEWQPYYEGGSGEDRVVAVNGTSLRVSTGVSGGWYGATSPLPSSIADVGAISFAVRYANWEDAEQVLLIFSTGGKQPGYFAFNLKSHFAHPKDNEWYRVVLDRSAFQVIEGNPDWATVTDVVVRVVPVMGKSARVWLDDVMVHPVSARQPVITYTFDDGFAAVPEKAKLVMDRYSMRGTAFVIPDYLGQRGYMAQAQVDELAAAGWDIGGHGKTNLTHLDAVTVDADLAKVHKYLTSRRYQGSEHYAYPNGGYNEMVSSQVLEYFTSARTIDGLQQPPERVYPQSVNAITISSVTPVTEVIDAIDTAAREGTWLILVWHDFNTAPDLDYEYHTEDFEWITAYIATKKIPVRPYSEVYAEFMDASGKRLVRPG